MPSGLDLRTKETKELVIRKFLFFHGGKYMEFVNSIFTRVLDFSVTGYTLYFVFGGIIVYGFPVLFLHWQVPSFFSFPAVVDATGLYIIIWVHLMGLWLARAAPFMIASPDHGQPPRV